MRCLYVSTVFGLMKSFSPISEAEWPPATRTRTSRSRPVREARPAGGETISVLDGAQHAVPAEVPLPAQVVPYDEALGVDAARLLVGHEHPAHPGGDDVLLAGPVPQSGPRRRSERPRP
jgi:hypothetical protein